jgi:predicted enzyme related to lactoylglutathione lyase
VKNRVHLDLRVADVEAATARVHELGARVLRDVREHGGWFRVLADPEGNEFCLVSTLGSQPW